MNENLQMIIFGGLLGIIVFQYLTIQKLVNKVMSKDFSEYTQAKSIVPKRTVKLTEPEVPEDLRSLQGFNIG